jgi:hypothetical protein
MPRYLRSLAERLRLDDPETLRALGRAAPPSAFLGVLAFAWLLRHGVVAAVLGALLGFGAGIFLLGGGSAGLSHLVARAAAAFLLPSGNSSPGEEEFSRERALVAAGKVNEALGMMERRREAEPANAALVLLLAETYARDAGQPRRAVPLFRAVREMDGVSPERDLYATNRLVDLYLGPLEDRAGAARELRRILRRHPGSRAAAEVKRLLETL